MWLNGLRQPVKRRYLLTGDSNDKYTKEFKLGAVCLVTEQSYSCADAARSLDVAHKRNKTDLLTQNNLYH